MLVLFTLTHTRVRPFTGGGYPGTLGPLPGLQARAGSQKGVRINSHVLSRNRAPCPAGHRTMPIVCERAMSTHTTVVPPASTSPIAAVPARPVAPVRAKKGLAAAANKYFYTATAVFFLLIALVGFSRFYMHGMAYVPGGMRPLTPPIRGLVITHGVTMSLWLIMLLVQPLLVATGNRKQHMLMGWIGTALAAAVTVTGVLIGCSFSKYMPPEAKMWGISPLEFTIVPLGAIALFAVFVALGIALRRKPALHRPMMFLATLAALTAALNRIDWLNGLYIGSVFDKAFGPFFTAAVIGVALVAVRSLLSRRLDKPFAVGVVVVVAACTAMWHLATTPLWVSIATKIAS